MTPAASWSPADYYAASRAARRAWQATSQQLAIDGLDSLDVKRAAQRVPSGGCCVQRVEPAATHPPVAGGLAPETYDDPGASSVLGARRGREGV